MQNFVQQYYDQGIFTFTFEGITADTNDKGKVVKKSQIFKTDSVGTPLKSTFMKVQKLSGFDRICF